MKKLLLTLILTIAFLTGNAQSFKLGDVNRDSQVNVADVMMVVDIILNGYKPLEVSSDNVVVSYGESTSVKISSGYGPYTITSSDEKLISVSLNGELLTIEGKSVNGGLTVVTISDMSTGRTKDITVTVEAIATPADYLTCCPDDNHPHMIDMGLPSGTKWACCNVGASNPEEYGGYYGWGETETKDAYVWSSYIHCDGIEETCHDLGSDIAGTQYDVAHVKWGGSWVMPSLDQIKELEANCTHEWTTVNGVNGGKFTGKYGGTIFLPTAGQRYDDVLFAGSGGLMEVGDAAGSWSSTNNPSKSYYACYIYSKSLRADWSSLGDRVTGRPVRPVSVQYTLRPLLLSKSSVSLYVGKTTVVEINFGNGSYKINCSATNVATTTLSGNAISITGMAPGTAVVTVTDTITGYTKDITVTVETVQIPTDYLSCPDDHHPHLIDLGLPSGTKWACCNVDTDHPENQSPTNYGGYYAWGETETKGTYDWSTYTHCGGSSYTCHDLGSDISGTQYDVANEKWGGLWVMPSVDQIKELLNFCSSEWTTVNGVNGRKFIGKNGGKIFLPAVGYRSGGPDSTGTNAYYWSTTPYLSSKAYCLDFYSDYVYWYKSYFRADGRSVRPVINVKTSN